MQPPGARLRCSAPPTLAPRLTSFAATAMAGDSRIDECAARNEAQKLFAP